MPATHTRENLAERIDRVLPQTQCRLCGHDGCRPYADAIAAGAAPINRCPPGGAAAIREIAALVGIEYQPLDPGYGVERPPLLARIDESACIGCALCLAACPVDAIVGAAKSMHTVIAEQCTGCGLCVPPCPVDCIVMHEQPPALAARMPRELADAARRRYTARNERLERQRASDTAGKAHAANNATTRKRAAVARAVERARLRLQQRGPL
jgi:Na+-translocating ferredoxin:NAD+ oxidoreductase subunit B